MFDHGDTFGNENPVTDCHNDCPWQQYNSKVVFLSSSRGLDLFWQSHHTQKEQPVDCDNRSQICDVVLDCPHEQVSEIERENNIKGW